MCFIYDIMQSMSLTKFPTIFNYAKVNTEQVVVDTYFWMRDGLGTLEIVIQLQFSVFNLSAQSWCLIGPTASKNKYSMLKGCLYLATLNNSFTNFIVLFQLLILDIVNKRCHVYCAYLLINLSFR